MPNFDVETDAMGATIIRCLPGHLERLELALRCLGERTDPGRFR